MAIRKAISLPNHEIVTLAVYLLGGERQPVDTEDIAVKANELASGGFHPPDSQIGAEAAELEGAKLAAT